MINEGRVPFLTALIAVTLAAVPLCGVVWRGGPSGPLDWQPDAFHWQQLVVAFVVTVVAILVAPLRSYAGLLTLIGVPLLVGVWAYARNPERRIYHVAPLFEQPSTWGLALAFAVLAALAGWRRGDIADAHDRNGLFVGAWLAAAGAVIALLALGSHDWLHLDELVSGHVTTSTGAFVGLRRAAFALGALTSVGGIALATASLLRRRCRRRFLAAVADGQVAGWSIEPGDESALPLFLDPSRRPTGILVRGKPGYDGPRVARVRVTSSSINRPGREKRV